MAIETYTLSLHVALPILVTGDEEFDVDPGEYIVSAGAVSAAGSTYYTDFDVEAITVEAHQTTSFEVDYRVEIPDHTSIVDASLRSEEHTSELQSRENLVC